MPIGYVCIEYSKNNNSNRVKPSLIKYISMKTPKKSSQTIGVEKKNYEKMKKKQELQLPRQKIKKIPIKWATPRVDTQKMQYEK